MDRNNQQERDSGCCCQSIIPENENIKKMKPILIVGIVFYIILTLLDTFYLRSIFFFSYTSLVIFLCLMVFNGFYYFFSWYVAFSTLLLFVSIIPTFLVPVQTKFKSYNAIGAFIIHFIAFVFYFVYFYFGFKAYKEMKYIFQNTYMNGSQLNAGLVGDDRNYNSYSNSNNYNNYNRNNTNSSSSNSRGFKAFSGKGYTVGGS